MDSVPLKTLEQSSSGSTEGESWVYLLQALSAPKKRVRQGRTRWCGWPKWYKEQLILSLIWGEESPVELGALRYTERKRRKCPIPRIGSGRRMLTWGKVDVPSDLRTIAIKTIPHLYLDIFEHVTYGNYSAYTYLLVFRWVTQRNSLVSWHLYLRYPPIFFRLQT